MPLTIFNIVTEGRGGYWTGQVIGTVMIVIAIFLYADMVKIRVSIVCILPCINGNADGGLYTLEANSATLRSNIGCNGLENKDHSISSIGVLTAQKYIKPKFKGFLKVDFIDIPN